MYMGMSRLSATVITFVAFLALAITVLLTLVPVIWQQSMTLIQELPNMIGNLQIWLHKLPEMFPSVIDESQINELTQSLKNRVVGFGESLGNSLCHFVNKPYGYVGLFNCRAAAYFLHVERS